MAARFQHAPQFVHRLFKIVNVLERAEAQHQIEVGVRERQRLSGRNLYIEPKTALTELNRRAMRVDADGIPAVVTPRQHGGAGSAPMIERAAAIGRSGVQLDPFSYSVA